LPTALIQINEKLKQRVSYESACITAYVTVTLPKFSSDELVCDEMTVIHFREYMPSICFL